MNLKGDKLIRIVGNKFSSQTYIMYSVVHGKYGIYNVAESNSISVDELKYFLMPGWGKHELVLARTNENSCKKIL